MLNPREGVALSLSGTASIASKEIVGQFRGHSAGYLSAGCIIQNCPAIWHMFNACCGPWPVLTSPQHSMLIPHPRARKRSIAALPTVHGSPWNDGAAMVLGKFDSYSRFFHSSLPRHLSWTLRYLQRTPGAFCPSAFWSRRGSNSWGTLANFNRVFNSGWRRASFLAEFAKAVGCRRGAAEWHFSRRR